MIIKNILTPERTLHGVQGVSKKKILETIAEQISEHVPAINAKDLFNNLINRERLGTTGLGNGIALPHCRSKACPEPTGLFIRLSEPVDFDAVDREPVDLIFALIVPEESTQEHLDILKALAQRFTDDYLLGQIRSANSSESLYQILTAPA
ncbi:PTS IIA-like nitrogen regulatory protein PtsN [Endozoicomonas gorgoniicola]|uniref:PTS IIA-like nitrogen regulatory protein PtsN n=1 Tax=Endozoicomonas gorgoniicola TaxID=1234144 RepID=A0ABT3N3J9_9GAMM|nr:PTS IIA-like nitrogen regulatory protein PtsN [Endozoicomonas gorgoniicola]MCW7556200.1 PTS IIA-like nitrogen regulatory protein PtsN [Endozoicomonas gorgoniicola]